ncbi:MAG: hypothetical protein GY816_00830 [Cytophagales bacterium]|nr:hypothetical protein [Cytophagales bacterium]
MKFRRTKSKNKLLNPIQFLSGVALLLFLVLMYFKKSYSNNRYATKEDICNTDIYDSFEGKVHKAFFDASHKGVLTVVLSDRQKQLSSLLPNYGKSPIMSGDSIVKLSGKSYYVVYKRSVADSVIRLDFDCDDF